MAHKGKPAVLASRPWWRHPRLPWGWYSLVSDRVEDNFFEADGYRKPGDGGACVYRLEANQTSSYDDGAVIIQQEQ